MSIDDFYKVLGYTCFYKSDVQNVDAIKADDITITLVSKSYPKKMVKHLRIVRKFEIAQFAEEIFRKYQECKDSKLHQSVMDIIVRANEDKFMEAREGMCDALVELMQDVIDDIDESLKGKFCIGKYHLLKFIRQDSYHIYIPQMWKKHDGYPVFLFP